MRRKIYSLIIWLGMGSLFYSCEKELEQYAGVDYIRFSTEFATDSVDYNFGLAGKPTTDRIGIEMRITGEVSDEDRAYSLVINEASTAKEGVHFSIPAASRKIRAHHVVDTLWIEVVNSEELRTKQVYLQLDLEANDAFRLCFPESNSCKVYLTDKIVSPDWWDEWHETEGLGTYSEKKYRLFIQVSGVYDLGENVEYPERREAILKFKYYLEEEADKGNVILDEDNMPMRVAMYG